MLRDLQEISDGKIYGTKDMVRAACRGCEDCHACCVDMGESILLDPSDIRMLSEATGSTFEQLTAEGRIALCVADGMILPYLKMDERTNRCGFLDEAGRCRIHTARPGLCRVFPLGRIYEEGRISYFLQAGACEKPGTVKVKVGKWLDGSGTKQQERFLLQWHGLKSRVQEHLKNRDEAEEKTIHLFLLQLFYVKPYDNGDFYVQFEKRLEEAEKVL